MDAKSELALYALRYVINQAAKGHFKIPLSLNINEQQAYELLTLNNQELHDMAIMANLNILTINFDTEALKIALEINNAKSQRRQEIFKLLKAGASYPVLNHLYGLTTDNIGHYRRIIDLPAKKRKGGRPAGCTEEEKTVLWGIMGAIEDQFNNRELSTLLLDAHEKTGLEISSIWTTLKEWWGDENHKRKATQ